MVGQPPRKERLHKRPLEAAAEQEQASCGASLPTRRYKRRSSLAVGRRHPGYAAQRDKYNRDREEKQIAVNGWLRAQVDRLREMLAWRRTEDLLPEGDYTDTQLDRAQQQVLVLVAYYDKLLKANELGVAYSVYECAEAAAGVLGDGFNVTHRTVRAWSAQYIKTGGKTQPDGRGYYERELLINEEDLKRRFVKWSLRSAKSRHTSSQM